MRHPRLAERRCPRPMRSPTFSLSAAVFALGLVMPGPSLAQTTSQQGGAYTYDFKDADRLAGDTLGSPPPILSGPIKTRRVMLIRARTQFVSEMLKSVETL